MPEFGFVGRITDTMAPDFRDVAKKVWSLTRGRIAAYDEVEMEVLVTNLKNATNAWMNFGSGTLTRGPSAVSADLVTAIQGHYDGWIWPMARTIWARVSADKDYQDISEIDDLVASLKAAINYWMWTTPDSTDVSEEAPYAPGKIGASS